MFNKICGRPQESFETIARRYIAQPDLIVPGLRVGTKLGALAFMVKMMLTRAPDLDRWERERGHPVLEKPVLAPRQQRVARSGGEAAAFASTNFRGLLSRNERRHNHSQVNSKFEYIKT